MTRSIDAGFWRPVWIAAFLVIVLSAPALAADWQPITGSQTQTTPRPATQPSGSGSGGYGGIPTWGRGGGWSGEPDHPHPPAPTPAPVASAGCSLHLDPQTAVAGDYATVIATFSDAALSDLGRMDLLVDGRPAAGAARQGNGFTYAFRVPAGQRQVDVSLTAYASRTGNYGQIRILCSASASLTVMDLILDAPDKVVTGSLFSAAASVVGGQPPFTFSWWPSGRVQTRGSESTFFNNFEGIGSKTLSVEVSDGAGRRLKRTKRFQIIATPILEISGPSILRSGQKGTWTVTSTSQYPPVRFTVSYGGSKTVKLGKKVSFTFQANPGANSLVVTAEDRAHSTMAITYPVQFIAASTPAPTTGTGASTGGCRNIHGCSCPGGGRTWQLGQTCCGSVICQPGMRCVSPGTCR